MLNVKKAERPTIYFIGCNYRKIIDYACVPEMGGGTGTGCSNSGN